MGIGRLSQSAMTVREPACAASWSRSCALHRNADAMTGMPESMEFTREHGDVIVAVRGEVCRCKS
jgi:hypothetical protein